MAALIKTSCLSEAGLYPFNMNKEALKNVEDFFIQQCEDLPVDFPDGV